MAEAIRIAPPAASLLHSLPRELRIWILEQLLSTAHVPILRDEELFAYLPGFYYDLHPDIICTCREFAAEGKEVMRNNRLIRVHYQGPHEFCPTYFPTLKASSVVAQGRTFAEPDHIAAISIRIPRQAVLALSGAERGDEKQMTCYTSGRAFGAYAKHLAAHTAAWAAKITQGYGWPSEAVYARRDLSSFDVNVSFPTSSLRLSETTDDWRTSCERYIYKLLSDLRRPLFQLRVLPRSLPAEAHSLTSATFNSAKDFFTYALQWNLACKSCIDVRYFFDDGIFVRYDEQTPPEYVRIYNNTRALWRNLVELSPDALLSLRRLESRMLELMVVTSFCVSSTTYASGSSFKWDFSTACKRKACMCQPLAMLGVDVAARDPPGWLTGDIALWLRVQRLVGLTHSAMLSPHDALDLRSLQVQLMNIRRRLQDAGEGYDQSLETELEQDLRVIKKEIRRGRDDEQLERVWNKLIASKLTRLAVVRGGSDQWHPHVDTVVAWPDFRESEWLNPLEEIMCGPPTR